MKNKLFYCFYFSISSSSESTNVFLLELIYKVIYVTLDSFVVVIVNLLNLYLI